MAAVVVRPRLEADLVVCEAIASEVRRRDGYPPHLPEGDFRRFLAGEDHLGAWVAEDVGGPVGHVALHRRSSPAVMSLASEALGIDADSMAVVARLLVRPDRRRHGVARLLMSEATGTATRLGRQPILDVVTQFRAAIALYEALGWYRLGTVEVQVGDLQFEEYVYAPAGLPREFAPPSHVWCDARLAVKPSAIEGRGLHASECIATGTVLVRLGGRLVSSGELAALIAAAHADPEVPYVDTITVYEEIHLVVRPGSPIHFGNHSCDPNTWHIGPYAVAARRQIEAGEEVTIDYGTNSGATGFSMTCRCGSALCRGEITSEDWRRPELQERYGDHWVPALLQRIRQSSGPTPAEQ